MGKKGNCSQPSTAPTAEPETPQPSVPTSLAVPTFLFTNPELWFARLDLFFRHRHVHDEETMFDLALSAMTEETFRTLCDFILTAGQQTAPFTVFKAICLDQPADGRVHRICQAITDEELAQAIHRPFSFAGYNS
ncbi:hypothetical protein TTRE_0000514501 [Trichuris trichiura]|uniref:DUF7041 domain-containing protein n=1 Tax=Trichuris trichiura TaxID=36087 RepID=A0A077Z8R9_TRITR|nr:hypothetical protein TTRE_0000514501 [Trichuris trichiura]